MNTTSSLAALLKSTTCELCRPEGRVVLVQFNSMGDPENGGRFTVKRYHSGKTISPVSWKLEIGVRRHQEASRN